MVQKSVSMWVEGNRRAAVLDLAIRLLRRARTEIWLLGALFLAAGGLWLFVQVADEVGEQDEPGLRSIDEAILLGLRTSDTRDPIGPAWLEIAARDFTGLGSVTIMVFLTLLAIASLLAFGRRWSAGLLFVSVSGGMLISDLLKGFFGRVRPDLVPHGVEVTTASFPSGHAMLTAVTYLTLGAVLASLPAPMRLKLFLISMAVLLTLLVGISRVYLGVHWPSDVLAGWCLGAAWAAMCWGASEILQRYWSWRTGHDGTSSEGAAF